MLLKDIAEREKEIKNIMDSAQTGAKPDGKGYNWQTSDDMKEEGGATFGLGSVFIVFTLFSFLGAYLVMWIYIISPTFKNNQFLNKIKVIFF